MSRARLERYDSLNSCQETSPETCSLRGPSVSQVVVAVVGSKGNCDRDRTRRRITERGDKPKPEIKYECVRACVRASDRARSLREHLGAAGREQVDTFREEIARRTDTSRARSSYPQHPAVEAVERDEAEHARNSTSLALHSLAAATRPTNHHPTPIRLLSFSSSSHPAGSLLLSSVNLCCYTPCFCFVTNSRHRPRNSTSPFAARLASVLTLPFRDVKLGL